MIEVLTTAKIKDEHITLFGSLNEQDFTISLKCHAVQAASDIGEVIYQRPSDLQVIDMGGHPYSVYKCKFLDNRLSFGASAVSAISGTFSRVIKERKMSQKYNMVSFRFKGIEKFFPLISFVTTEETGDGDFSISKGENVPLSHTFSDGTVVTVESRYQGTYQSSELYNLDISQVKVITIQVPQKKTVDDLLVLVSQVKQYFEFISDQEILLEKVCFCNCEEKHHHSELISDSILIPKTYIKPIKDNPYHGTQEELIKGLEGWLFSYGKYKEVFLIWEKTIYNVNVAPEDLFIWRCQAFELLCTLESTIYERAKKKTDKKQQEPNLKNFLSVSSNIYSILPNLHEQYYADVKLVRDKLTHHNPRKSITDDQKKNSYTLIKYFWISVLIQLLGITGISRSLCLTAHSKQINTQ